MSEKNNTLIHDPELAQDMANEGKAEHDEVHLRNMALNSIEDFDAQRREKEVELRDKIDDIIDSEDRYTKEERRLAVTSVKEESNRAITTSAVEHVAGNQDLKDFFNTVGDESVTANLIGTQNLLDIRRGIQLIDDPESSDAYMQAEDREAHADLILENMGEAFVDFSGRLANPDMGYRSTFQQGSEQLQSVAEHKKQQVQAMHNNPTEIS